MNRLNIITIDTAKSRACLLAWLVALSTFFSLSAAQASTLKKLFEVGIPVISQSDSERAEASKQAFEILLVRITGLRDFPETENGQQMIKNARQYVSSFRYEAYEEKIFESSGFSEAEKIASVIMFDENAPIDEAAQAEIAEADVEEDEIKPTQKLIVSFDEKAVKGSLWKQKLPVWGKTRPSTLLWIAVQDANQRVLLDINEPSALQTYIEKQAEQRGVPLLFPLLDLEDQMSINVTDIWGAFKDPIEQASERYQPEAILSARLFLDPFGSWQTRWTLHQGGDEFNWQVTQPNLEAAVISGIDQLADKLAQRYAHISSAQDDGEFLIYVTDVKNLADFVKVNKYLASLSSIKRADVARVKGDELVFRLDLRSSPKAVKQAIKLGKTLFTTQDPFAPEIDDTSRMVYRLMP